MNTDCTNYDGQCNLLLTYLLYNPVYELRDCELLASDSYASWYTFLGSSDDDFVSDICGGRDRLFVTGNTNGIVSSSQGVAPISGYPTTPPESKIMVAVYGSGGNMNWFRILGAAGTGQGGTAIAAMGDGGALLLGNTAADIPSIDGVTPLQAYQGSGEFIIIRFDKNGYVQWYTFFGGSGNDQPRDIIATSDGGALVCGSTNTNIPGYAGLSPILPFSNNDAVFLKLSSNGTPEWYTFLGTAGANTSCSGLYPYDISGFAFAGIASQDITSLNGVPPVQNHSSPGTNDMLLGRINNFGYVQWYTMLGAALNQNASHIVVDADDNLYFGGGTTGNVTSIGSVFPVLPYNSGTDPMFGKLNASGQLLTYGFIGTASNKQATGINIDRNGNILFGMGSPNIASLAGVTPSHPFSGGTDDMAFFEFDTNFTLRSYAFLGDVNSDYDPVFAPVYNGGFLVTGNTLGPLNSVNGRTTLNAHGSPGSLEDWFIARFLSVKDL